MEGFGRTTAVNNISDSNLDHDTGRTAPASSHNDETPKEQGSEAPCAPMETSLRSANSGTERMGVAERAIEQPSARPAPPSTGGRIASGVFGMCIRLEKPSGPAPNLPQPQEGEGVRACMCTTLYHLRLPGACSARCGNEIPCSPRSGGGLAGLAVPVSSRRPLTQSAPCAGMYCMRGQVTPAARSRGSSRHFLEMQRAFPSFDRA